MWNSILLRRYEKIRQEYDTEVRIKCGKYFNDLNNCFKNNLENIEICNFKKKNFETCTKDFDEDFREEYKFFMKNIKTYF
jgi:hypothetical protein